MLFGENNKALVHFVSKQLSFMYVLQGCASTNTELHPCIETLNSRNTGFFLRPRLTKDPMEDSFTEHVNITLVL